MAPSEEERQFRETVDLKDPVLAGFLAWLIPGLGHLYQGRRGKAGMFFVCIFGTFLYGLYLGSGGEFALFQTALGAENELDDGVIPADLRRDFQSHRISLPEGASVSTETEGNRWRITADGGTAYTITKQGNTLNVLGQLGWARVVYASWRERDKRLPYLCQVGAGLPALPALVQTLRAHRGMQVWWNGFMAPPSLDETRAYDESGRPTANTIQKKLHPYFELGTVYTMIAGLLNILAVYDACCGPVFGGPAKKGKNKDDQKQEGQQEDASPQPAP